jgi:tetratricopeptide (TPR) repeat protein
MSSFLNRKKKVFRSIVGVLIYSMLLFPTFNAIGLSAMDPAKKDVKLSKKEKKKLVEEGVAQYQKGERDQAKKTLEYAKEVFPANYAVPYYLGLIYLEEGRRSDAIAEWKQYIQMDPKSEDSLKIRKYLTLLIREEAVEYAKQAVANEATLLSGPVTDNAVAVTSFKNLGSENLGPLGKGMAAMLIHDLSQVPDLQVVERIKLQALLQEMKLGTSGMVDQKTAPKVSRLLKTKHVTTGSLADLEKENLQIVSAVIDSEKMETIDTQEAQGALKKFYDLEKDIACDIIKDLGRDCSKMPKAFGKVHTKSLAALTAYSIGLDYFDQERYDEAREEFQKAIDEDPDFDLAKEALILTPLSAMALMSTTNMISTLSASSTSSATIGTASAGTAIAGGGGVGVVGVTTGVVVSAAAAGGLAAAASGGGGDDGDTSTTTNLTGVWSGTWNESTGDTGNVSFDLTQTNTSVSGSVSTTGSNCISTGTLSGTLAGNQLTGTIQSVNGSVSLNATATSTSMNGTYEVTSGECIGDTGSFSTSITTTGSATINWPTAN